MASWPLLLAATDSRDAGSLTELAARIDLAREAERRVREEWDAERSRLEVLESALVAEHDRAARRLQAIERETNPLEGEIASFEADVDAARHLPTQAARLAQLIEERCRAAETNSFLGLHSVNESDDSTKSDLGAAFDALAAAERRARTISRRQLSGVRSDGSLHAAEVLVVGGVAAWWRSPDGSAGPVRLEADRVHFDDAPNDTAAENIGRAFRMHAGEIAGGPTSLPVPELRPSGPDRESSKP